METADRSSGSAALAHVANEGHEAIAYARRVGVRCVTRTPGGAWREAASWRGTREATDSADRMLRLHLAERSLRATGPDAARRRRLRLAELELRPW